MPARKRGSSFAPRYLLIIVLIAFSLYIIQKLFESRKQGKPDVGQKKELNVSAPPVPDTIDRRKLPLPAISKDDEVITHLAYTVAYSEKDEEPKWVAYRLCNWMLSGHEKRSGDFREDPAVPTGSACPQDYRHSGYDKGHICPAADMHWSRQAMSESFFMSNITPQDHGFNDGIWAHLEKRVRGWAKRYGEVYIASGPILKNKLPKIGMHKVSVPEKFYKVILAPDGNSYQAIGFIIPNNDLHESYYNYAVPIDSVEKLTGIDFFPLLNDSIENRIEAKFSIEKWQ